MSFRVDKCCRSLEKGKVNVGLNVGGYCLDFGGWFGFVERGV